MSVRHAVRLLSVPLLALLSLSPIAVQAQDATPAPPMAAGETVASGLTNPRGMTWGPDGTIYVALAGSGGTTAATEEAPTSKIIGPFSGGLTGAVAKIGADGCPALVAGGLPSTSTGTGEILGAEDVAFLGGQLYVSADGEGPVHGNADAPSGVYRVLDDGSTELVADLSAWVRANPVANVPGDHDPDAAGYSMLADEASGVLWVIDPNSGQLLSVSPEGEIKRVADLSAQHPVPTRMVADPEGGIYVGTLTAAPFSDGTAKVMHVAADGTATDVWTGLTAVTAVAVGSDGALYALEMSTGNLEAPPFLTPNSGRIVRQTGPDQMEVVVDGLMLPIAMAIGSDGMMYVSVPAVGASGGEGMIVRFSIGDGMATPMSDSGMMGAGCTPLAETISTGGAATPMAG